MKKQIASALVLIAATFQVQASSIQTHCSTADGSYKEANGHFGYYRVTKMFDLKTGETSEFDLSSLDLTSEVVARQELGRTNSCDNYTGDEEPSFVSGSETTFEKIVIRRTDGSAFPKNLYHLSADGTALEVEVLCKTEWSSMGTCR